MSGSARIEQLAEGVTGQWVTIYALCEPVEKWRMGEVRYVGKTVRTPWQRVRAHSYAASRPSPRLPVLRWLKKQMEAGNPFHIKHLERVPPGADWAARERYWIAKYRADGAKLLNLTDGGEGLSGLPRSEETRAKVAAALRRGAMFSCEVCSTQFWRKPRSIKSGDCRFCSRDCYQRYQIGKTKPVPRVCTERGVAAAAAKRRSQTHCKRGHMLSGDNLFRTSSGARGCKECRKIHKATHRSKSR